MLYEMVIDLIVGLNMIVITRQVYKYTTVLKDTTILLVKKKVTS